jgi:hypothetical protein
MKTLFCKYVMPVAVFGALGCFPAGATTIVDSGAGFSSTLQTNAGSFRYGMDDPPNIQVMNSPLGPYSATQSASPGYGNATDSVGLTLGNGNIGLHGGASTNSPSLLPPVSPNDGSNDIGDFNVYAYDSFYFAGPGYETFQYTLTLDGSVSITGDPVTDDGSSQATANLNLYIDSSYQTPGNVQPDAGCSSANIGRIYVNSNELPCGQAASVHMGTLQSIDNGSTVTGTISIEGPMTVELGLYLYGTASTYNYTFEDPGSTDIQAQVDALNTGYFTLTPITPGATYTTASGLTYAASPDVPEPAPALMLLGGVAGIWAVRRRKRGFPA